MRQRVPLITFVVGVVASDLTYRFTEFSTYQVVLVVALALTALLYALTGMHALLHDAAFPLAGGFAMGGVIKWIFATMLS